jgi:putative restriction endonuclease
MNPLQRALIEKAGQEQGWECALVSTPDAVELGSARHKARVRIVQADATHWTISLAAGLVADELVRSFPDKAKGQTFRVSSVGELCRLLRRAAELAQSLPNQAELTYEARLKQALAEIGPMTTEVERLVMQRVGQDTFRQALLDYWGGACAVTGIALPVILRASHAKPWADCATNSERLDVFNGFLLTANLDALFDRGLISFNEKGAMIFSQTFVAKTRIDLGLTEPLRLRWISEQHQRYLNWHRDHVFERRYGKEENKCTT